tara:strand:+ start:2072 stop:2419 length:348 start_codon:yes stop_codon:yes gene_type:complete
MAHKGLRNYSADEISNIAIGQGGFDIIGDASSDVEKTVGDAGVVEARYWVAIKAINGADAEVTARTLAGVEGDDFSKTGSYNTGQRVVIENGDIIYGVFDKISIKDGDFIIAYRG